MSHPGTLVYAGSISASAIFLGISANVNVAFNSTSGISQVLASIYYTSNCISLTADVLYTGLCPPNTSPKAYGQGQLVLSSIASTDILFTILPIYSFDSNLHLVINSAVKYYGNCSSSGLQWAIQGTLTSSGITLELTLPLYCFYFVLL